MRLKLEESILLVVDIQSKFMTAIPSAAQIASRSEFLARAAQLLGVPVFATEQNPSRLGSTIPSLEGLVNQTWDKMAFSACAVPELKSRLKPTVILVGVETHICISQTATDLIAAGRDVYVCLDAVGSRTQDRHEAGLARLNAMGATPIHTEAVVYDWLQTAEHAQFRDVLELVKRFP